MTFNKENEGFTADVVVVGGGPGGAVTAKNCAQRGMRTLLLERKKLPRRKVCGGFIHSHMAQAIIDREFGTIPDWVLNDPPYIYYATAYPSAEVAPVSLPYTNRNDLDYWMVQKAKAAGAEIWEEATVTDVIQETKGITLKIRRLGEEQKIRARFVVGADGAASITRKSLYPSLNVRYSNAYQECYPGELKALDRKINHIFPFHGPSTTPSGDRFSVRHNRGGFVISVNDMVRRVKESMSLAKKTLAEKFGFDPKSKPLWADGCPIAALLNDLYSGKFIPAKGNILLVGDAAGLATPNDLGASVDNKAFFGEGINTALKSGLLAASAIVKAADTSQEAATTYLAELQQVISVMKIIDADVLNQTNETRRDKLLDQLI